MSDVTKCIEILGEAIAFTPQRNRFARHWQGDNILPAKMVTFGENLNFARLDSVCAVLEPQLFAEKEFAGSPQPALRLGLLEQEIEMKAFATSGAEQQVRQPQIIKNSAELDSRILNELGGVTIMIVEIKDQGMSRRILEIAQNIGSKGEFWITP